MNTTTEILDQVQDSGCQSAIAELLSLEMAAATQTKHCTKRTAVRLAINNAIRSEVLKPGDFLPSEKELTKILGVSLGTVQSALRQLQEMGIIIRRRGDGTRVAAHEPLTNSIWLFRFLSKNDQTPLRIQDENLKTETTDETGIWSEHLGQSDLYIRIRRRLTMRNGTAVGAEMYLAHSAAFALETIDETELQMANIRTYLEETLGLATKGATHYVKTVELEAATANQLGLQPGGNYYEIHARAHSPNRQPVYFQRIFVSSSDCVLVF